MERIVNYSSEEEYEDSPKRNANIRDRNQGSSLHRDRDNNKESSQNVYRKNSHKEESNRSSRPSSSRDQHYHRDDRRTERSHEKKRDSKDDRRRKDNHRERDRDYEHRELDRDRRDRSDKHRRDRYGKDNSHREKGKRRRSSDSPTPSSKDHNTSSSSRHRNRSRSRSPSKDKRTIVSTPPASGVGKHQKYEPKEEPTATTSVSQNKNVPTNLQAVLSPPLSDEAPKTSAIVINKTDGTPIALPTYYNPNIINPTKYAEQVQKRKLIWGAKKAEDTSAKWGHATFSEDSDGKVASKFMRLMGIKSAPKPGDSPANAPVAEKKGPDVKSRQAMFSNMEQQYEVARQVTHTMRGVGLGFGSQSRQY
ncbi:arginine/serine-rich coiled-coil protein 2 isoform X2 [Episyrphus balteatus]|uniref:arginine/serine-rich coiled-coil protein 2 isoform X2 n=1 Tax=Episyrphus balteatus TaxID=286459 RepID=UPI00248553AA|nr:arginine/serine-rich coiled-coil protein 2 isoform X2 [Episyrphus balteatus]